MVYRNTSETLRLDSLYFLDANYGKNFYSDWTFFKIQNSTYIEWLLLESRQTMTIEWYIHFCFITVDSIIDVVTTYKPRIELF